MEWLVPSWMYLWIFPDQTAVGGGRQTDPGAASGLSDLDLWLIAVTSGAIAAQSTCTRCPAPLRRRIRVDRFTDVGSPSAASAVTTCAGWRRHRHVATVTESANHLVFGPFRSG
jgi:hypothetical protein